MREKAQPKKPHDRHEGIKNMAFVISFRPSQRRIILFLMTSFRIMLFL